MAQSIQSTLDAGRGVPFNKARFEPAAPSARSYHVCRRDRILVSTSAKITFGFCLARGQEPLPDE